MATLLRYIICPVGGFSPSLWKIWSGQLGWMEIPNMWKVIKTMFHYWLLYPIISHEKNTNKNPIKSHVPVTTNQITIIFPLLLVYSLLTTITINHQPGYPIYGKIQSPPTSCWMVQLWIPSRPLSGFKPAFCLPFQGESGQYETSKQHQQDISSTKGVPSGYD